MDDRMTGKRNRLRHLGSRLPCCSVFYIFQMRLDPQVELAPSNMVPLEAFTTDDNTKSDYVYYQSEDEKTISL